MLLKSSYNIKGKIEDLKLVYDLFTCFTLGRISNVFSTREHWMKCVDNICDRDSGPIESISSIFGAMLGLIGYGKDILTSIPYSEKRNKQKYETQLMIETLKNERQSPHIKTTSPFKGIDIIWDYAVQVLSNGSEEQKLALYRTAQIFEMISQKGDYTEDKEKGNPNIFDPRIANEVRRELRKWDSIEEPVINHNPEPDLRQFEKQHCSPDENFNIGLQHMLFRVGELSDKDLSECVGKTLEEIWNELKTDKNIRKSGDHYYFN